MKLVRCKSFLDLFFVSFLTSLFWHVFLKMLTFFFCFLLQIVFAISLFALLTLVVPGHALFFGMVYFFTRLPARSPVTRLAKSKGMMWAIGVTGGGFQWFAQIRDTSSATIALANRWKARLEINRGMFS